MSVPRSAGTSARQQAEAARAAAPVRSFVSRLLGIHTDERAWRVGAQGERAVGARLARLPETWFVCHDIEIGARGANVDHLVIGPGGVFSLNTKNLRGRVWVAERTLMVNGHRTDFLVKAARESDRVAKLLTAAVGRPILVRGVIVLICPQLTIKSQPTDVGVVTHRGLGSWLTRQPARLAPEPVSEIAAAARRATTWQSH